MNKEFEKYKIKKSQIKEKNMKFIEMYVENKNKDILNIKNNANKDGNNQNVLKWNQENLNQRKWLESKTREILSNKIPQSINPLSPTLLSQFFELNQISNLKIKKKFDTPMSFCNNPIIKEDVFLDNLKEQNIHIASDANSDLNSFILHLNFFKTEINNLISSLNNGVVDLSLNKKILSYINYLFVDSKFCDLENKEGQKLLNTLKVPNSNINKEKNLSIQSPKSIEKKNLNSGKNQKHSSFFNITKPSVSNFNDNENVNYHIITNNHINIEYKQKNIKGFKNRVSIPTPMFNDNQFNSPKNSKKPIIGYEMVSKITNNQERHSFFNANINKETPNFNVNNENNINENKSMVSCGYSIDKNIENENRQNENNLFEGNFSHFGENKETSVKIENSNYEIDEDRFDNNFIPYYDNSFNVLNNSYRNRKRSGFKDNLNFISRNNFNAPSMLSINSKFDTNFINTKQTPFKSKYSITPNVGIDNSFTKNNMDGLLDIVKGPNSNKPNKEGFNF